MSGTTDSINANQIATKQDIQTLLDRIASLESTIQEAFKLKDRLLTTEEAAEMLRLHPETIRKRVRAGYYRNWGSGGKILVKESEIKPERK